jgi:hypothetical protein
MVVAGLDEALAKCCREQLTEKPDVLVLHSLTGINPEFIRSETRRRSYAASASATLSLAASARIKSRCPDSRNGATSTSSRAARSALGSSEPPIPRQALT